MSKLSKLPPDVAEEIKSMTWEAVWHTANTRAGNRGDAEGNRIKFEQHYKNMCEKAKGLGLSESTLWHIKWLGWDAGWHTANTRAGKGIFLEKDAKKDKIRFDEHAQSIIDNKELTSELVKSIKLMAWNAAWHTANTRSGFLFREDAKADRHRSNDHFSKIVGEVTLIDVCFLTNKAKVLSEKPKILAEQELKNYDPKLTQQTSVEFKYTEGKTNSWGHKIGFKAQIKNKSKVSFSYLLESQIEVSFESSAELSWSGSTHKSEACTYKFPIHVSPMQSNTARAIVHEVEMEIPYELEYELDGTRRTIHGIWHGVACSKFSAVIDPPKQLT